MALGPLTVPSSLALAALCGPLLAAEGGIDDRRLLGTALFPIAAVIAAAIKWSGLSLLGSPRQDRLIPGCLVISCLEVGATWAAFWGGRLIALPGGWVGVLGLAAGFALPPNLILADWGSRGAAGWKKALPILVAVFAFPLVAGAMLATVEELPAWLLR